MIKIPNENRKLSQPNNSDLFGNLNYTKNLNLDEEGYIKVSPRSVALTDSATDANFKIPFSFGREDSGKWSIATGEDPIEAVIDEDTGISAVTDNGTSKPNLTYDSRGKWWQNRWHVTDTNDLFYKTTANWTDANVTLTSGLTHAMEVFKNRNEFCITDGNTVIQVDTSYSTTTNLVIPSDFEAVSLAYNGKLMAVATKLSSSASVTGQNTEAFLFLWDGETTEANDGFSVGSDTILAVVPYRSSFVALTRTGELKYFNGGGFDLLGALPFYFFDKTWGDAVNLEALGDIMSVDGDVIYININNKVNTYGIKSESVVQSAPGGVWCYDPKVGLYHRHSPSISPVSRVTVTDANVNTTTDIMTSTAGTIYATGNPVKYISDKNTQIGGLKVGQTYYVIRHTATTFSLATTKENAENGTKIDLTSTGTTSNYFLFLNVLDYGATRIRRTGGIGIPAVSDHAINGLIYGGELYPISSAVSSNDYLNFTVTGFESRGYFVTPKISSQGILDINQKGYIKYRPLKSGEKIIVKTKIKDVIGIPVTTPQIAKTCTWTSTTAFTTTADLSEVESYINDSFGECEVEIISGAGAGSMEQISTISENAGTYTVTLENAVDGAAVASVSDIIVDNWKKVCTVTSDDVDGYKEFPISGQSRWVKLKVELRGSETTVEELSFVSQNNKNAV